MRKRSTNQVAAMLGMHQANLQRLIRQGKLEAPPLLRLGQLKIRLWSGRDIERARAVLRPQAKRRRPKGGRARTS